MVPFVDEAAARKALKVPSSATMAEIRQKYDAYRTQFNPGKYSMQWYEKDRWEEIELAYGFLKELLHPAARSQEDIDEELRLLQIDTGFDLPPA